MPAVIDPPGELMYSQMSRSGSSPSRYRSWAMRRLATLSFTSDPRKTMRSLSSRRYTSCAGSMAVAIIGTSGGLSILADLLAVGLDFSRPRALVRAESGDWGGHGRRAGPTGPTGAVQATGFHR